MGRKAKYSKEIKLEIVRRYLKGESPTYLANQYGIPQMETIIDWARRYEVLGERGLETSNTNKTYSKELKEMVIKEYIRGGISLDDLVNKYNITDKSIVRGWLKKYNSGIEIKDYKPKSEVYTMKSRKTTVEERLEIVQYVLANNYDYKGAADKYSVPYASVYQWVSKYNQFGEEALSDKRGRPSTSAPKKEITEVELKDIEIEKLKRESERQKMINEVLKKNIEIQERMEKDSRKSYKRTNTKQ